MEGSLCFCSVGHLLSVIGIIGLIRTGLVISAYANTIPIPLEHHAEGSRLKFFHHCHFSPFLLFLFDYRLLKAINHEFQPCWLAHSRHCGPFKLALDLHVLQEAAFFLGLVNWTWDLEKHTLQFYLDLKILPTSLTYKHNLVWCSF